MGSSSTVKTVTISSSSRFYETAKRAAKLLESQGLRVFTPRFEFDETLVNVTADEKAMLTREFLGKIARSDALYVIDEEGYTGRSVCIEIGYAYALGKKIVLCETASEGAVAALSDEVVPMENLLTFLER